MPFSRADWEEFWERNRSFLTPVLAGAGLFVLLAYVALSFGSESAAERKRRLRYMERVSALRRRVADSSGFSTQTVQEAEKELAERSGKLSVVVPSDLESEGSNLATRFLAAKEKECVRLARLASECGVDLGVNLSSVDFHQREGDGPLAYEGHYSTLCTFSRLLDAALRARVTRIVSVTCEGQVLDALAGEPAWMVARYGVTVEFAGTYASCLGLFREVLKPGRFVCLELKRLRPRPEGGLLATVTGWGVRLVEAAKYKSRSSAQGKVRRLKR